MKTSEEIRDTLSAGLCAMPTEIASHSIKISRAQHAAKMLPKAEAEIMASIPCELFSRLTARELALVMLALNGHWHKARKFERHEICADGCVFDDSSQRIRELR